MVMSNNEPDRGITVSSEGGAGVSFLRAGEMIAAPSVRELNKDQKRKLQELMRGEVRGNTCGVILVILTVVIVNRWPEHFWIYHIVLTVVLLIWRCKRFIPRKMELYMLDWCYVLEYLTLAMATVVLIRTQFGIVSPLRKYNAHLLKALFAMACGPLPVAVIIFRNTLVFHSIDHMTSVFIHLSPLILAWCIRWGGGLGPLIVEESWPDMWDICPGVNLTRVGSCVGLHPDAFWCPHDNCPTDFVDFLFVPMVIYVLCWALPFFTFIAVLGDWIERTGRDTLYHYFCKIQPGMVLSFQRWFGPMVGQRTAPKLGYMLLHFAEVVVCGAASVILWRSFVLHTTFIGIILFISLHNGSSFTFNVFAFKYAEQKLKDHPEILRGNVVSLESVELEQQRAQATKCNTATPLQSKRVPSWGHFLAGQEGTSMPIPALRPQ